jgi:hypothetical protein
MRATSPTGRAQIRIVTEEHENASGEQTIQHIHKSRDKWLPPRARECKRVSAVAQGIIQAVNQALPEMQVGLLQNFPDCNLGT